MIVATPETVRHIAAGKLDHPEGICLTEEGVIYAGGEAGQIYRISLEEESVTEVAHTGGFVLGLALDGGGDLHVCDAGRAALLRVNPATGTVTTRSTGVTGEEGNRPLNAPNYPAFDAQGNLYVSHNGEYWDAVGTGAIFVVRPDDTTEVFHEGPFRFANGLAVSPDGRFLYVAQSTAANVVRITLDRKNGPIEIAVTLPEHTVPDGLIFTADGSLIVTCYRPDIVYIARPDGTTETLIEDHTAELLMRPTNGALRDGKLYLANLGGWQISVVDVGLEAAPLHRPVLPVLPEPSGDASNA